MTTITTYAELRQNIQDYTKRNDILSKLDQFIDAAESQIRDKLRVREMEVSAPLSTSTSDRYVALPDRFISARQLKIMVDDEFYEVMFTPLAGMNVYSSAGIPSRFTVTSRIELNRTSDQVYSLTLDHYAAPLGLSSSNTTNDVLTNHSNVYLAGCLEHAFRWSMQYDLADYWASKFNQYVAEANRAARKGRIGPNPQRKPLRGMIV